MAPRILVDFERAKVTDISEEPIIRIETIPRQEGGKIFNYAIEDQPKLYQELKKNPGQIGKGVTIRVSPNSVHILSYNILLNDKTGEFIPRWQNRQGREYFGNERAPTEDRGEDDSD